MLSNIAKLIEEFFKTYHTDPLWDVRRTERANTILPMIIGNIDGDILEIGAHRGISTNVFCRIGAEYGRHVFVIDPWDGRQEGSNSIYTEFQSNTGSCKNLTVYRAGSENPDIRQSFLEKNIKFAFILVDGLHTYDAVKNDIERYTDLLIPNGVICFDDWRGPYAFCQRIREAVSVYLKGMQEIKTPDTFIEQYFIKLEKYNG